MCNLLSLHDPMQSLLSTRMSSLPVNDLLFPLLSALAPGLYSTCKAMRDARRRMATTARAVQDIYPVRAGGPGDFLALIPMRGLRTIQSGGYSGLTDLAPLTQLPALRTLICGHCPELLDLSPDLQGMTSLTVQL